MIAVLDAERCLLGAMLTDSRYNDDCFEIVDADDFSESRHKLLFRTFLIMAARGIQPDLLSVTEVLRSDGTLGAIGGKEYLIELTMEVTSSTRAKHHARMVSGAARVRRIAEAAGTIAVDAEAVTLANLDAIPVFADEAQETLWKAGKDRSSKSDIHTASDSATEAIHRLSFSDSDFDRRVQTGLTDLDSMILGLRPSEVAVFAGRPGAGKTTIGSQIAINSAREGKNVLFVSFEMSREEITDRLLANISGVSYPNIRSRRLDQTQIDALVMARDDLSQMSFKIATSLDPSPSSLRSLCRKAGQMDLIVLDYLQYMREKGHDNRWSEVSSCSHAVKTVAKEFNVAFVSLAQLGRMAEKERPRLSHLRESGSIEQDADQVVLLHQPEDEPGILMADVAKNRHGATGSCRLQMVPERFFLGNAAFKSETVFA